MIAQLSAPELRHLIVNALLFVDETTTISEYSLDGVLLHEVNDGLAAVARGKTRIGEILGSADEIRSYFMLFINTSQANEILEFINPLLAEQDSMVRFERSPDARTFTLSNPLKDGQSLFFNVDKDEQQKAIDLKGAHYLFEDLPLTNKEQNESSVPADVIAAFGNLKEYRLNSEQNDPLMLITADDPSDPSVVVRGDWFRGILGWATET